MIAAVLFDLDETLLDRTGSLDAFLDDQYGRLGSRLGSATLPVWKNRFLALDARGHVHKSVVYPALLDAFGGEAGCAAELLADYRARCSLFARPFAGMEETLRTIRVRGLKLGIVTNGETDFQTGHVRALGLEKLTDAVLVSESEGLRKPDLALFQLAASRLGVAPHHCLFVGNNPVADIGGAAGAGMRTAWFHGSQEWPPDAGVLPDFRIDRLSDVVKILDDA